jgi:hypothetical protein
MKIASATSYTQRSLADVPDHIVCYLATKLVTLPQWIGMQDFWRGGDDEERIQGTGILGQKVTRSR